MKRLSILLTGVTGKFGKILTKHFILQGHHVTGVSRSQSKLIEFENQIDIGPEQLRQNFTGIEVDLVQANANDLLCDTLSKNNINITHLINNARNLDFLKIEDDGVVSAQNFMQEFFVDVVIPYQLSMALLGKNNSFLKQIINIGSQYGSVAANLKLYDQPDMQSAIHYGVAKAALVHLTKEMAIRLASRNVQVNCVSFGGVEGRVSEEFKTRYSALVPIGRMLHEEEICIPIDMLINHPTMSMTGHTIHADGGWTLW
jgi:NAD(P)-dependent dehydrogenase (short-subunit alcohol dehydrogenase family)